MSTETDRLAREAEERRSNLDATLESLKGKLSPGQVVDELTGYLKDGQGAEMLGNLNRQVRDNPLALGLIGAGAAWLLFGQGARDGARSLRDRAYGDEDRYGGRTGYDPYDDGRWRDDDRLDAPSVYRGTSPSADTYPSGTYASGGDTSPGLSDRARSAAHAVGSSASHAASGAGSAASRAGHGVSDAASSVAGSVSDAASSVADAANRLSHDARDAASRAGDAAYRAGRSSYRGVSRAGDRVSSYGRRARRSFLDTLQDEPLILGAVALAVGAAIGAALPSTRVEDEWMGDTRDRLRDGALEEGRGFVEKASTAAQRAYEAGSEEAENKGLKPSEEGGETIADKVTSVAKAATGAAREEFSSSGDKASRDTN